MALEAAEREWLLKVAKIKADEKKDIKAKLEKHLIASGRAAEASNLDPNTATEEALQKDALAREQKRAKAEVKLQNDVTDRIEAAASTSFAANKVAGNLAKIRDLTEVATPLNRLTEQRALFTKAEQALANKKLALDISDPALVKKAEAEALLKDTTLNDTGKEALKKQKTEEMAREILTFRQDRAIAKQLQLQLSPTHDGVDLDAATTLDPTFRALVDDRKVAAEMDNVIGAEIEKRIQETVPTGTDPLTRNEKIEEIVIAVAAEYGETNLAHFIGRHGATRVNESTGETARTKDDMVSRLVTGVGADRKKAKAGDIDTTTADVTGNVSGTTGPGTGKEYTVPNYTKIGDESQATNSQHASAKAALYMLEDAASRVAEMDRQMTETATKTVGGKTGPVESRKFRQQEKLISDVATDTIDGRELGAYSEEGKLGTQFLLDKKPGNPGTATTETAIRYRMEQAEIREDNPAAEVLNLPDKLHGGMTPMSMYTKSDRREGAAVAKKGNVETALNRGAYRKAGLNARAEKADAALTELTKTGGRRDVAKTAFDVADSERDAAAKDLAEGVKLAAVSVEDQKLIPAAQEAANAAAAARRAAVAAKKALDSGVALEKEAGAAVKDAEARKIAAGLKIDAEVLRAEQAEAAAKIAVQTADDNLVLDSTSTPFQKAKVAADNGLATAKKGLIETRNQAAVERKELDAVTVGAAAEQLAAAKAKVEARTKAHTELSVAADEAESHAAELLKALPTAVGDKVKALAAAAAEATALKATVDKLDTEIAFASRLKADTKTAAEIAAVDTTIPSGGVTAAVPGSVGPGADAKIDQLSLRVKAIAQPLAAAAADLERQRTTLPAVTPVTATHAIYTAIKPVFNHTDVVARYTGATPDLTKAVTEATVEWILQGLAKIMGAEIHACADPGQYETKVTPQAFGTVKGDAKREAKATAVAIGKAANKGASDAVAQAVARVADHPAATKAAVEAAANAAKLLAEPKAIAVAKAVVATDAEQARGEAYRTAFEEVFKLAVPEVKKKFDEILKLERDAETQKLAETLADAMKSTGTTDTPEAAEQRVREAAAKQKQDLDARKKVVEDDDTGTGYVAAAKGDATRAAEARKASKKLAAEEAENLKVLKGRPAKLKEITEGIKVRAEDAKEKLLKAEKAAATDGSAATKEKLELLAAKAEKLEKEPSEAAAKLFTEADDLGKEARALAEQAETNGTKQKQEAEEAQRLQNEAGEVEKNRKSLKTEAEYEKEIEKLAAEVEQAEKNTRNFATNVDEAERQFDDEQKKEKAAVEQLETLRKEEPLPTAKIEEGEKALAEIRGRLKKIAEGRIRVDQFRKQSEESLLSLRNRLKELSETGTKAKELREKAEALAEDARKAKERADEFGRQAVAATEAAQKKAEEQKTADLRAKEARDAEIELAKKDVQGAEETHTLAVEARKKDLEALVGAESLAESTGKELKTAEQKELECAQTQEALVKEAEEKAAGVAAQAAADKKAAKKAEQEAKLVAVRHENRQAVAKADLALAESEHEARVADTLAGTKTDVNDTAVKAKLKAAAKREHTVADLAAAEAKATLAEATTLETAKKSLRDRVTKRIDRVKKANPVAADKAEKKTPLEKHEEPVGARLAQLDKALTKAKEKLVKAEEAVVKATKAVEAAVLTATEKRELWEKL